MSRCIVTSGIVSCVVELLPRGPHQPLIRCMWPVIIVVVAAMAVLVLLLLPLRLGEVAVRVTVLLDLRGSVNMRGWWPLDIDITLGVVVVWVMARRIVLAVVVRARLLGRVIMVSLWRGVGASMLHVVIGRGLSPVAVLLLSWHLQML